jgi:hypothetical protein
VRSRGKVVLNAYSRMVAYFAYTQLTDKWREWTFRSVSQRQAELLVAAGEATAVTRLQDGAVRIVGYRALKPTSWERPSPATLTFATMVAVGNNEAQAKLTRRERMEIIKFKVWPLIGDTKAVCVRPRISAEDRRMAEAILYRPAVRCRGERAASGMLSAA